MVYSLCFVLIAIGLYGMVVSRSLIVNVDPMIGYAFLLYAVLLGCIGLYLLRSRNLRAYLESQRIR